MVKIDPHTNLLNPVRFESSPNCDERPAQTTIDMIVIHGISLPPGKFGGEEIQKFFCNKLDFSQHSYFKTIADLKVCAHLLIDRKGTITQFAPFSKRAWHAGKSFFAGKEQCNDFSIGIELEGTDELPYEKIQYEKLAEVIKLLQKNYPAITRQRIVGHSDIAPGRKTDPGASFDWSYLDYLLNSAP